ncbi:MAG: ExbD/TolR family protein [Verrucomicrobiia bacterium]
MKFSERKHRQAPTIIIISLIDILIVLLIFLMVTTTFKQQPALKLVLPESQQAKQSGPENGKSLLVTIAKQEPYFYLGRQQVTSEKLEEELRLSVLNDPEISVFLQPDTGAPFGQVLKVWDAVKLAGIKQGKIHVLTKPPGSL